MKLCFIASRLFSGGFTTSMLAMMKQLNKQGIQTDLIFLDAKNHEWSTDLVKDYHVTNLNNVARSKWDLKAQRLLKLTNQKLSEAKKIESNVKNDSRVMMLSILAYVLEWLPVVDLREYDAVISWEEITCNYFLAYNVKAKKKIAYIHPDYILSSFDKDTDYDALKKMDKIVSVSEATTQTLREVFPEFKEKIFNVPNVLDTDVIDEKVKEEIETFDKSTMDIVTVCRLSIYHKGLDRLMYVAKRLDEDHIPYEWYICGEGDGRSELEAMIERDHLTHVHLLGAKANPYPFMKKADLFVLLSNYEGKPVVIDEAMYLSVPCFVTNYASSIEQINSGVNGWIVPIDDEKSYIGLKNILNNREELNHIKENLYHENKNRFTNPQNFLEVIQ